MLTTNVHPYHLPATSKGMVFHGSVGIAGFTATAGAQSQPMMALWNPISNNTVISILNVQICVVSGTAAGVISYYTSSQTSAPVGGNLTTFNGAVGKFKQGELTPPSAAGKFYSNTALGFTPTFLKSPFTMGTAAGTAQPGVALVDYVDGAILLNPGGVFAVTTSATGTSFVVGGSVCWEETPLPTF